MHKTITLSRSDERSEEEEEEEEDYDYENDYDYGYPVEHDPRIVRNSNNEVIDLTKERKIDTRKPVPKGRVRLYYRQKKGWGETIINFTRNRNPTELITQSECFTQYNDPKQREVYLFGCADVQYEPGRTEAQFKYFY